MKKLLLLFTAFCVAENLNAQANIAAARASALGSTVSIKGITTNGDELGATRYIQDPTGGLPITGQPIDISGILRGDSLMAVGTLTLYSNELFITNWTVTPYASGKPVPAPLIKTPSQLNESAEGWNIRVNNCTFTTTGNFSGANYTVSCGGQTMVVQVASLSNLDGSPIPTNPVDIIGIGAQACNSPTSGCTTGYFLKMKNPGDVIASGIRENNMVNKLSIFPVPADQSIQFDIPAYERVTSSTITNVLGKVVIRSQENKRSVNTENLEPGIYFAEIKTDHGIYSGRFIISR